jgi:hypothetical protein
MLDVASWGLLYHYPQLGDRLVIEFNHADLS